MHAEKGASEGMLGRIPMHMRGEVSDFELRAFEGKAF